MMSLETRLRFRIGLNSFCVSEKSSQPQEHYGDQRADTRLTRDIEGWSKRSKKDMDKPKCTECLDVFTLFEELQFRMRLFDNSLNKISGKHRGFLRIVLCPEKIFDIPRRSTDWRMSES